MNNIISKEDIKNIVRNNNKMLTFQDFRHQLNQDYTEEEAKINAFFDYIDKQEYIILTDRIIRYLGYKKMKNDDDLIIKEARKIINKIIINNKNNIYYKTIKYQEGKKIPPSIINQMETKEEKYLKQINFYIFTPDDFTALCLLIKKPEANDIRTFFIKVRRLMSAYEKYQIAVCKKGLRYKDNQIKYRDHLINEYRQLCKDNKLELRLSRLGREKLLNNQEKIMKKLNINEKYTVPVIEKQAKIQHFVLLKIADYTFYMIRGQNTHVNNMIKNKLDKYENSTILIKLENHPNPIKFGNALIDYLNNKKAFIRINSNKFKLKADDKLVIKCITLFDNKTRKDYQKKLAI